jgi:hypothetical protein
LKCPDDTEGSHMEIETCAHPACSCAVTGGARFCSKHCEVASKDVAKHDTCECGHKDCTD